MNVLPDASTTGSSSVSPLRYVVADVFTSNALEGNQLAVFTDARGLSASRMQALAKEMNFAESVFVLPAEAGGDARIRIFTPANELPFAGHPVLGTAFVLGRSVAKSTIGLETGAGLIPVELERDGSRIVFGRMRQPIPHWEPYKREVELLAALGVTRSGLPVEAYRNGPVHVFVELGSEDEVARLRPDLPALASHEIGANCFAGAGRRWKTRMFAPAHGVAEDAASGSAAGPLALHLARHGRIGFGEQIEIRQGAEIGRPSVLYARAQGSAERLERIEVSGSAVVVAQGEFSLD